MGKKVGKKQRFVVLYTFLIDIVTFLSDISMAFMLENQLNIYHAIMNIKPDNAIFIQANR